MNTINNNNNNNNKNISCSNYTHNHYKTILNKLLRCCLECNIVWYVKDEREY